MLRTVRKDTYREDRSNGTPEDTETYTSFTTTSLHLRGYSRHYGLTVGWRHHLEGSGVSVPTFRTRSDDDKLRFIEILNGLVTVK